MQKEGDRVIVGMAIVGSGHMARQRAANIAAAPRARLVAISSRNQETGQALAADYGCVCTASLDALLERSDVDAVLVCATNGAHGELALAVLRAGRHTLIEYPLALEARQAAPVAEEALRRGLVAQVGYDQLWLGPHAALREAIRRDGPPLEITSRIAWAGGPYRSAFRNVQLGGSPALVKSYYLYAILDWLGAPSAHAATVRYGGLTPDGYYDAAAQHVVLDYPDTLARCVWIVGPDVGGRQKIHTELTWAAHALVSNGRTIVRRDAMGETPLDVERVPWSQATYRGLEHFIAAILDNTPTVPALESAALTVQLAGAD